MPKNLAQRKELNRLVFHAICKSCGNKYSPFESGHAAGLCVRNACSSKFLDAMRTIPRIISDSKYIEDKSIGREARLRQCELLIENLERLIFYENKGVLAMNLPGTESEIQPEKMLSEAKLLYNNIIDKKEMPVTEAEFKRRRQLLEMENYTISQKSEIQVSRNARDKLRFEIEIWHESLNKSQTVRDEDPFRAEAKACQIASKWDELWMRKVSKDKTDEEKRIYREQVEEERMENLAAKEASKAQKEKCKAEAEKKTSDAQADLLELEQILIRSITVNNEFNWENLKCKKEFSERKPEKRHFSAPIPETFPDEPKMETPVYEEPPREPQINDAAFQVKLTFLDSLFGFLRLRKENLAEENFKKAHADWILLGDGISVKNKLTRKIAERKFFHAHEEWANNREVVETRNKTMRNRFVQDSAQAEIDYHAKLAVWTKKKDDHEAEQKKANALIDEMKANYLRREPQAIGDYCEAVLSKSSYPKTFPKSFGVEWNPGNQILIVDYQLPTKEILPTLKEVKFIASSNDFHEKHISEAEVNRIYDNLLYQMALRTLHELFQADTTTALLAIAFNGYVNRTNLSTGKTQNVCVLSLQVGKKEFMAIDLANVDVKACFKGLKGVAAATLSSVSAVAPLLRMNRADKRFVVSYPVAETISEGENLAAMDWEDFEHLIRELFEKEFAQAGGDVKVTRASRDGGVDAVVFDPDPIRGGKIVIQAKRYTNTVGVSAVRDLYGTVINEGANKGILVSTADYGPDAYEFANGKPLTLINGGNLLHLLEKHGHKARINLMEAKLQASGINQERLLFK